MVNILLEEEHVSVPDWVVDLESFRRWLDADDVPEKARISYFDDEVWVDVSREQVFTHVGVKTEFTRVLAGLVKQEKLGLFLADGVRVTNVEANFSVKPDVTFASQLSLEEKRVWAVEGAKSGYVELEGTPDMVLEVVSDSSVRKDTKRLRQRYWEAGIPEYWLVDARGEAVQFDIFRHTSRGYVATRKQEGWLRSNVFGKAFRLNRQTTPLGHTEFTLEVR